MNFNRIKEKFSNHRLTNDEILKVSKQYENINSILKFKLPIEDVVIEHFRNLLNIHNCKNEIDKLKLEIKKYENNLRLNKREEFDNLRQKGQLMEFLNTVDNKKLDFLNFVQCLNGDEVSEIKLERFRKQRDLHNKNYNELNLDGNVSMGSNTEIWR